jgi:hypothetical protein
MNTQTKSQIEKDAELIESLGGPTTVARMLGFEGLAGSRRVFNWTKRGIPAQVRIDHPDIFLAQYTDQRLSA